MNVRVGQRAALQHPITALKSMENAHSLDLASPTETTIPPLSLGKRAHAVGHNVNGAERAGSESIDANALTQALKDFEDARRTRDSTPTASPSRKRQRIYGDRSVFSLERASILQRPEILSGTTIQTFFCTLHTMIMTVLHFFLSLDERNSKGGADWKI